MTSRVISFILLYLCVFASRVHSEEKESFVEDFRNDEDLEGDINFDELQGDVVILTETNFRKAATLNTFMLVLFYDPANGENEMFIITTQFWHDLRLQKIVKTLSPNLKLQRPR